MPDNYPNARFRLTQLARDTLAEQGLTVNDAVEVAQGPGTKWDGYKENQWWHRGACRSGKELMILVEDNRPGDITIITVRTV